MVRARERSMGRRAKAWRVVGLAAAVLGVAGAAGGGCLFPPEEGYPVKPSGAGGVGGSGGAGGSGGGGVGGSGGVAGSGGSGGCAPGTTEGCYTGPVGTEGVGICHGGMHTCGDDGQWGLCEGETTPGQEVCGNAVDEDCSGGLCGGEVVWALAASATGEQTVYDAAVDDAGNVLVAGTFTNGMTIGNASLQSAGGLDAFLLKVDAMGNLLSLQRFGGMGDQYLRGVAVDGDGNVYLTGYFGGTMAIGATTLTTQNQNDIALFVARLDAQGNTLWAQDLGTAGNGDEQYATGAAVVGVGDVVITGSFLNSIFFDSTTLTSAGSADIFLARLDKNGAHQWIRRWGNGALQRGVRVAAGNHVFVTGDAEGSFDIGGTTINGGDDADVLALQHDTAGTTVGWVRSFGDPLDLYDQLGYDIALDPAGNVLLSGKYQGDVSFGGAGLGVGTAGAFVAKLSEDGVHQWSKAFAGLFTTGRGVAADSAGNVLVTGEFVGPTDFGGGAIASNGADLFVVKLAPDGSHLWSRKFGDVQGQIGVAVAADPTDHAIVAGHFTGQLDFGVVTLSANGAINDLDTVFLAKLAP